MGGLWVGVFLDGVLFVFDGVFVGLVYPLMFSIYVFADGVLMVC